MKKKDSWPERWGIDFLESVVEKITNGINLPQLETTIENSFPISRIETIANETVDFNRVKYVSIDEAGIEKYALQKGDILFSHINSDKHLGKTAIFEEERTLIHGVNLLLIRANSRYNKKLLNYLFKHYRFQGKFIEVAQRAVNQSSINQKKLKAFTVPIIELPEQQRIVARLDALFGHLDSLREKLDRVPVLLKNFRQQILTQAVTGEMTKEWREGEYLPEEDFIDPEDLEMREIKYVIPKSWQWLPFISVAEVKSNLVQPNEYLEFPLIAPDNIEAGTGKLINKPLVSEILPKSPKHYFCKGDIVYSKIRPYLSKLVLADFDGLCSADMYPISTSLNIKYLYYYMLSDVFLRYATTAGERSVLPKINQKELAIIPISVPSKKEQQEIVNRIEALFSLTDKIESQYTSLKAKIDQLPQAILGKAFRGELVGQEVKEYVVEESEGLMAAEPDSKSL